MKKLFILLLTASLLFVTGCNVNVTTGEDNGESTDTTPVVNPVNPSDDKSDKTDDKSDKTDKTDDDGDTEDPETPTDPSDSTDPVDPADPADPETPTDPVDPADPETPTDPETPVDPTDPVDPDTPVDPTDPVDPETPADPDPVPPALVSISLDTSSAVTFFFEGDAFSYDGLVVTAHYDDETSAVVEDFTVNPGTAMDSLGAGKSISVSYEGCTETYNIDVAYKFHETVKKVKTVSLVGYEYDKDTKKNIANAAKTYDIVSFGDFPRTVMPVGFDSVTDRTTVMGGNTYYLGTDGYWYYQQLENAYDIDYLVEKNLLGYKENYDPAVSETYDDYHREINPKGESTLDTRPANTYSDGTVVQLAKYNSYRWFKVEPIYWRVLTDNYNGSRKALLLAEEQVTAGIIFGTEHKIGGTTVYASNYKYSNVRAYLNGSYEDDDTQDKIYEGTGFMQKAFTSNAQTLISLTDIDNSEAQAKDYGGKTSVNLGTPSKACDNTKDKVFLLSEYEITIPEYGFAANPEASGPDSSRRRLYGDFSLANYALNTAKVKYTGGWWWTRSPSNAAGSWARITSISGWCSFSSPCSGLKHGGGIVPALCVSPDKISE